MYWEDALAYSMLVCKSYFNVGKHKKRIRKKIMKRKGIYVQYKIVKSFGKLRHSDECLF
ncbi:hypothetical protein MOO46_07515 (plasmid) [Apilactobacillus apisilvae]|uniref:Uncharacterized protein n=1 Tax=Apilactobacillus apisilvae TaxID=2923364 RepID=A0ABY4PJX7_9LACO|nr:hypothetical protein [Apilactobacillus apisilvae]UQS85772.1 hypothetical protein MOO46_07515 [Apilactobacillus apisilvae]